jgi:hypothetical protein
VGGRRACGGAGAVLVPMLVPVVVLRCRGAAVAVPPTRIGGAVAGALSRCRPPGSAVL